MKRARRGLTIVFALGLATIAALVVYSYTSSLRGPITAALQVAPTATPVPSVPVLVARGDIAANTVLTADALMVQRVPRDVKNVRALGSVNEGAGRVALVALAAGEQILSTRLGDAPGASETFARAVPVGKRAVSVVFDEVIGSGALVQPGDHVDVIAYFEFAVKDPNFQGATRASASSGGGDGESSSGVFDDLLSEIAQDHFDYKQYVSTYVVQDVEVLAVSQALTPDDNGTGVGPKPDDAPKVEDADNPDKPVARPTAKSVTLAVTPEQAQRLLLAAQTVTRAISGDREDKSGSLRLALRAPGDTTTVDFRPAQLGDIPLGSLLGDVNVPMTPSDLVISDVVFTERVLTTGSVLEFKATVKNVSEETIKAGSGGAPPEYTYTQGDAYDTLGFFEQSKDAYRIGLNVAGAYPSQFPYRWDLGRDLKPGETITVVGSVRLTDPTPATRYWLGVIKEPNVVTQDGVGVAEITVNPPTAVDVVATLGHLRTEPDPASEVVYDVLAGARLEVFDARDGWYLTRVEGHEGWIEAAAVKVEATAPVEPAAGDGTAPGPEPPVDVVVSEPPAADANPGAETNPALDAGANPASDADSAPPANPATEGNSAPDANAAPAGNPAPDADGAPAAP